jgi:hypothetical protein
MDATAIRNRFPVVVVAALAAALFIGFAKTYFFRFLFDTPPLTQGAHIHALIAIVWVGLHFTQARLVAAHRVDVHRRLGILAACVAALLAVQAMSLGIQSAATGHAPPTRDPLQFLSVSLGGALVFAVFVATALALRRRREWHKRLMLLASLTLLTPAIGRLDTQIMQPLGLPRTWLPLFVTCGFLAWACTNDWRQSRRVHPAYIVGGIALLASMPARVWLGTTEMWQPFARWLVT